MRPRLITEVPGLDPKASPFERFQKFVQLIAAVPKAEADREMGKVDKKRTRLRISNGRQAMGEDKLKTKLTAKAGGAKAVHLSNQDEALHLVGLGNIRVVIIPDEDAWFAQGLEIDYGAQGASIEEAQANFQAGLTATIEQHLKMFGTIEKILRAAPPKVLVHLLLDKSATYHKFSQVTFHEVNQILAHLPFQGIDFYKSKAAAA
jgi:hypothetical protein